MAEHNLLGQAGEDLAADFLLSKGYYIRHRNWRAGRHELDIIAVQDGTLVVDGTAASATPMKPSTNGRYAASYGLRTPT